MQNPMKNYIIDYLRKHGPPLPLISEPHSSSSEEDVPTPVLLTTVDDNLLIIRTLGKMVNSRRGSRANMLSASMPVLNTITDCSEKENQWRSQGKIAEPLRTDSYVSMNVRKWIFPSVISLSRPSSNANTKSAPGSPHDVEHDCKSSDSTSPLPSNVHLSPNRTFTKTDRHAIKQLSTSTPAMAHAHSVARGPTDPDGSVGAPLITRMSESSELIQAQGSNKTRQKKFNRHFKQVGLDERVLDYYSCALVGDILLQGRLYVTKNYFAFYSNVFGYVTKLLIPMVDVMEVSKEKTAKIIPNAVGISTEDEKHVFGSLLSRDSTYKFMVEVWHASKCPDPAIEIAPPKSLKNDAEDSASGDLLLEDDSTASASGNEEISASETPLPTVTSTENYKNLVPKLKKRSMLRIPMSTTARKEYWNLVKPTTVLAISTALLVSLYLSAGFLLYRIAEIQNHFHDYPVSYTGDGTYHDILKWQSELHSRSANEVHEFLNANLNQIAKVRLSLEALSMLILTGQEKETEMEKSKQEEKTSRTVGDGEASKDVS